MRFGKIPAQIVFVCAAARIFRCGWEDVDSSIAEDKEIIPSFPADAESADSNAQGRKWAAADNQSRRPAVTTPITVNEEPNIPRTITLVGLEKRQEGGRAFKVIDQKNRLFDLREDVLLETLLTVGAQPGGQLNGQFVFAQIGSQMRLARVGSRLHAELEKSEERRQSKNIAPDQLVPGGVYANRRGLFIYVGRVDTLEELMIGCRRGVKTFSAAATSERKKLPALDLPPAERTIRQVFVEGEHLSLPMDTNRRKEEPSYFLANTRCNPTSSSHFNFSKSISAVEMIGHLDEVASSEFIEGLRLRAVEHARYLMHAWITNKRALETSTFDELKQSNWEHAVSLSAMLNLRPHGKGAYSSNEYRELLALYSPVTA